MSGAGGGGGDQKHHSELTSPSFRLHADWQRREAEQPHVAGGTGASRDPAAPKSGQGRPEGAVTPGEASSRLNMYKTPAFITVE